MYVLLCFTIFAGSSFKVPVIDAIFYVWDLQCRYIRIMLFKYFDHVAISFKSWQQCNKF